MDQNKPDIKEKAKKKKFEMDGQPLILYEFLTMIRYSMPPEDRKLIDFTTLEEFVQIVNSHHSSKFPIAVTWLAKWLGYTEERTLRDFILHRKRVNKSIEYKEDKDYHSEWVRTSKNQRKVEMYLSVDCFKDVCQQVPMEKGRTIRKYFIMVEQLYRDALQMKMSNRRESYRSEEEIENAYSFDDGNMPADGNITYLDLIIQHGKTFYKVGHTKQGRIRLVNLRGDYPGTHQFAKVVRVHANVALEEIIKTLSEKWMIQCSKAPCPREIILTKNFPVQDVVQASTEALQFGFRRLNELETLHGTTSSSEQSDQGTPFEFRRKGKRHKLLRGTNTEIS